ncbi:ROK family transcriptional regulator [Lysinibacter cavernae]|uniref:Glucokinase n=1 Tax=Lysinibacter cavernae TaxID=1640652 RepID=A0A7X5R1X2_9MICO|nr:ROK family transcriptional regulator [Lysinibacter cavernae]NIH54133.1 glucokinase [Lysinibacter cavernae]
MLTQVGISPSQSGAGDLLHTMHDGIARTKAEIISLTGLARSTVTARIEQLLELGLLREHTTGVSTGGRPPVQYLFNEQAGVIIGVELGATHGIVALTNLAHTTLGTERTAINIADGPETVLDWVLASIASLLGASGVDPASLMGIGIGVPGPVEFSSGRPFSPPIMPGWDRFDIPTYLQRTFDVPVLVDNDVNILALGEHATEWTHASDFIYVKVATGIGAGIIVGGQLQRGAQGSAGDIGHVPVPYSADSLREPTDERDLEGIASGTAIAEHLTRNGVPARNSKDVVELVRANSPEAIAATRQAGRELGETLSWIVSLLNPSVIAIGGSISHAGEHLLAGVREVVYKRSTPLATQRLTIVQANTGELAGAVGATILVTQRILSPEYVDSLVAQLS